MRPVEMVLIVHGFPSKARRFLGPGRRASGLADSVSRRLQVQGLQFEWAWQKPRLSSRVREVSTQPRHKASLSHRSCDPHPGQRSAAPATGCTTAKHNRQESLTHKQGARGPDPAAATLRLSLHPALSSDHAPRARLRRRSASSLRCCTLGRSRTTRSGCTSSPRATRRSRTSARCAAATAFPCDRADARADTTMSTVIAE